MKRIEALSNINSGKYEQGKTYVVEDAEAAALEQAGLVKIGREVIDLRPEQSEMMMPGPHPSPGKRKRRQ